jgi:hypothetical protein
MMETLFHPNSHNDIGHRAKIARSAVIDAADQIPRKPSLATNQSSPDDNAAGLHCVPAAVRLA